MKKLFFLICALLAGGVSGAWAQLTSITNNGLYSIKMARIDQSYFLGVDANLKHAMQTTSVTEAVFQFTETGDANTYYIKECSSGKYVYAIRTTNSAKAADAGPSLGLTTLPSDDTADGQINKLSAYKWIVNYVGTKANAENAWSIRTYNDNTADASKINYWAVWSQTGANPIVFYFKNDMDGYYNWGLLQLYTPTMVSLVSANFSFKQIKDLGYSVDDITTGCRPTTLDALGWPSTTAYNTFKSSVEALADGGKILPLYTSMWDARLLPTAGNYYRFKGARSNKYLKGVPSPTAGKTGQWKNTANAEGALSVFYYDTDNTLIAFNNGRVFKDTHSIANVGATGQTFTFEEPYNYTGALTIRSSAPSQLYSWEDEKDYVDRSSKTYQTDWIVEEVDELPITVGSAGYGTLCSPVALTLSGGLKAYTGEVDGDKLVLTEVKTTIPAGEPVILEGEGSYNLATTTGGSKSATNDLDGTKAAQAWASGNYTLQKGADSGPVGFYGNDVTTIPGFKAYLATSAGVKSFTFNFETAVKALEAAKNPNKAVYDMSGRRVKQQRNGLYIVNGTKVAIK